MQPGIHVCTAFAVFTNFRYRFPRYLPDLFEKD